jgi:hypothetical protein
MARDWEESNNAEEAKPWPAPPSLPVCAQAVAAGDLTQKIIVPVEGIVMIELKDIINTMVDRLQVFAIEVQRVSLEVGTEGSVWASLSSSDLMCRGDWADRLRLSSLGNSEGTPSEIQLGGFWFPKLTSFVPL